MQSIEETKKDLIDEIKFRSGVGGSFHDQEYIDYISEILAENGDLSGVVSHAHYASDENNKNKGAMRVDGFLQNSIGDGVKELTIIIVDFSNSYDVKSINSTEVKAKVKQGKRFVDNCLVGSFSEDLEESDEIYQLGYLIKNSVSTIKKINLMLITDSLFKGRLKELPSEKIQNTKVTYQLFDLGRYHEVIQSKGGYEPIEIDFADYSVTGIRAIETSAPKANYQSFLAVIQGQLLAEIYDEYSNRLLEQNVRTFLQARGKINKGIIRTVREQPEMFFAYNNGIAATATGVDFDEKTSQITKVKDLQIVNGAQTTASIHYAFLKDGSKVSDLSVQLKLSVVSNDLSATIVPNISQYSNTQNKVSAADFFANHPFHRNFEDLCERIQAPKKEASLFATKWFYERARGAYKDRTLYASEKEKKEFLARHPKEQLIVKTDLAKYLMSFEGQPHEVSKGAQAAFLKLSELIGLPEKFVDSQAKYNETWFRETIGKAIVFRQLDKLIASKSSDWYVGNGTKAMTITYAIAWLVQFLKKKDLAIDLMKVWKEQSMSTELYAMFEVIAKETYICIRDSSQDGGETQWAKRLGCWEKVQQLEIHMSEEDVREVVMPVSEIAQASKEAKKDAKSYNKDRDYVSIHNLSKEVLSQVLIKANKEKVALSPMESKALNKLITNGFVNEVEAGKIYKYLQKLNQAGLDLKSLGVDILL